MAKSTLVAPAFTGIKQHNFGRVVLLFVWTAWQDSLIGKERMSQSMGGNKMANASSISRMISKAGFQKSSEATTRIPGYHVFTEGFKVENGSSSVLVRYEFGSSVRSNYEAANVRRDQAMAGIVALLSDKGFDVTTSALQPNLVLVKKAVA